MSTSLSEVNKINLINIQPTTKYIDKNGPSTNPEYYVKKYEYTSLKQDFDIWFTDLDSNKIEPDSFLLELLLIY